MEIAVDTFAKLNEDARRSRDEALSILDTIRAGTCKFGQSKYSSRI